MVTCGTFAENGLFRFRQPAAMFADDDCVIRIAGEVRPFVRVVVVVVKLFGTIQIVNVSPAGRTDRMISAAKGGQRGPVPFSRGIFQKWFNGLPLVM